MLRVAICHENAQYAKVIKELFANTQYPGVLVGMDIDE